MFEARKMNRDTVGAIMRLRVRPDQQDNVASNSVSIAQAAYEPGATVLGLWDDDVAVGLLSFIDVSRSRPAQELGDDPASIYVWRLMIDVDHQAKGLGRKAMELVENHARTLGRESVYVTAVPDSASTPVPFYEKLGFAKTGRIIDDEVELKKLI